MDAFWEWLDKVFGAASAATPGGMLGLVVIVLAVLALLGALWWRLGTPHRAPTSSTVLFDDRPRSAAEHRATAEAQAAQGHWNQAVQERMRAVVRSLEERALLDVRPGRTADEAASEAYWCSPPTRTDCAPPPGTSTTSRMAAGPRPKERTSGSSPSTPTWNAPGPRWRAAPPTPRARPPTPAREPPDDHRGLAPVHLGLAHGPPGVDPSARCRARRGDPPGGGRGDRRDPLRRRARPPGSALRRHRRQPRRRRTPRRPGRVHPAGHHPRRGEHRGLAWTPPSWSPSRTC